jgi:hypothetical protein
MLDEPACWSWPVPPLLTHEQEIERMLTEQEGKPDALRYNRDDIEFILESDSGDGRMGQFHLGRCAICGAEPLDGRLVIDHCHASGQVRGWLCRSCNTREGVSGDPLIVRYRRLHPAALLNVYRPYSGRDWVNGWYLGEVRLRDAEAGPRPAVSWPEWTRETARVSGDSK